MKSSVKIISGYLLSFITCLLLTIVIISCVLKLTVLNNNYIKNNLAKESYYEKTRLDILEDVENYMTSSGIETSILDNVFNEEEIKSGVNKYIDHIYKGDNYSIDINVIDEKITNNIEEYLKKNKISYKGQELEEFKNDIIDYYKDGISFYNYLDINTNKIKNINKVLTIVIVIGLLISIINMLVVNILTKNKYFGTILLTTGLIIIYIIFDIYNKVDLTNIYIISGHFSNVLRNIAYNIKDYLTYSSIIISIIGLLIIVNNSFINKKIMK